MNTEERQILGWCIQAGEVPACVAAILEATNGPARFLLGLLVELQSVGESWDLVELIELSASAGHFGPYEWHWNTESEILRTLRMVGPDVIATLPYMAPDTLAEVEEACGALWARHEARIAYVANLEAAQARREAARLERMAAGCDALRALWDRRKPQIEREA